MPRSSLQSVRDHASRLAAELELALRSNDETGNDDSADDVASQAENEHQAIGPLHASPSSTNTGLGATAPGVGWGGKSQVRKSVECGNFARLCPFGLRAICGMCRRQQCELFHTMSEHEPPNDVALPPQVRRISTHCGP